MIIGFSSTAGYSCSDCKAFCCRSEYKLPLFPFESEFIAEKLSYVNPFVVENKDVHLPSSHMLIRTNQCLFLDPNFKCQIHSEFGKNHKPLVCQVYPLVFWKIPNSSQILAYLYPCKGLKWVSQQENRIVDVNKNYQIIKNKFKSYFGDQIDLYNPYDEITIVRVVEAQANLDSLLKNHWSWNDIINKQTIAWRKLQFTKIRNLVFIALSNNSELKSWLIFQRSAFHWLTFNPFLLTIDESVSMLVRLLAISWGNEIIKLMKLDTGNSLEINHAFFEQITWGMVQIVTSEWWDDLESLIHEKFSVEWIKCNNELRKLRKILL